MSNWQQRPSSEQIEITKSISEKDNWIYEGNRFSDSKIDGRYNQCDTIIFIEISRFICLYRFLNRYLKNRGIVRPDMPKGCKEKFDISILKYILFEFPKKKRVRQELFSQALSDGKNVIVLRGIKDVKKLKNPQKLLDIMTFQGKIVERCKSEHGIPFPNEGAIKNSRS